MGAGRKTQTILAHEKNPWPGSKATVGNVSAHARNLRKNNLGGVIFGCKNNTISECLVKQLFGLPGPHISYVRNIEPGLPLFLFNYTDRKLHGIYEAASHGQMNIDPYGWTESVKEKTSYPAQVRICFKAYCQPLAEAQFREIIGDNYYSARHFYFELDNTQVRGLTSLFTPMPHAGNLFDKLPTVKKHIGSPSMDQANNVEYLKWDSKSSIPLASETSWHDEDNDPSSSSKTSSSATAEGELQQPVSDWEDLDNIDPFDGSHEVGEESQTVLEEDQTEKGQVATEEEAVLSKLKMLVVERKCFPHPFVSGEMNEVSEQIPVVHFVSLEKGNASVGEEFSATHPDNVMAAKLQDCHELIQVVKKLKDRTMLLEKKQVESERELQQLRNLAKESSKKIQQLTDHVKELEMKVDPSMAIVANPLTDSLVDYYLGPEKLVYLIGGFDGGSWLSALDSYSPSLDILTPLRPMSSARSYASAATLNGCLYVFGGGDGSLWYDTVECYNPRNDEWTLCPPLVREKGSLAGATLNGKIFAIGGRDRVESFSDVEMFDPALGRWINSQSMLQKRFALAAAELNGALYAVGGFDGKDYLRSAERFDPREACWARLASMNAIRFCHSLAVLNEKIYAVGGYDGEKMVSSVEVLDPRVGSWRMGDPMNVARGYAAAPVLGDCLFVIGGVQDIGGVQSEENIVETVEYYKEGVGWTVTGPKAIGKRSFFSAVVL